MEKVRELIERPLSSEELAVRYRALCEDQRFASLPGKVELDLWGRMVMSPASAYRALVQGRLCQRLAALGGETFVEAPIASALGLFVADIAWASSRFINQHGAETPLARAPEICIEVVSPSNSIKVVREKVTAYLAAGAEEVWIAYPHTQRFEFHGPQGLMDRSRHAVDLAGVFIQPAKR